MLSYIAPHSLSFVSLLVGSIPEEDKGELYNTCAVFNPSGEMLGKYRKVLYYMFICMWWIKVHTWLYYVPIDAFVWYGYPWWNQVPGISSSKSWERISDFWHRYVPKVTIDYCRSFNTEWCKIGVGICYDFRFPELASIYSDEGVCVHLPPVTCL